VVSVPLTVQGMQRRRSLFGCWRHFTAGDADADSRRRIAAIIMVGWCSPSNGNYIVRHRAKPRFRPAGDCLVRGVAECKSRAGPIGAICRFQLVMPTYAGGTRSPWVGRSCSLAPGRCAHVARRFAL